MNSNPRDALKKKLWRKINAYAAAKIADSWKGSGDPESFNEIEQELSLQRKQLDEHIDSIFIESDYGCSPQNGVRQL